VLTVKQIVYEALDEATDNGFFPYEATVDDAAVDLATYCAGLEKVEIKVLEQFVREWLAKEECK
jgi:hypothetical protein